MDNDNPEDLNRRVHQDSTWEDIPKKGVLILETDGNNRDGKIIRKITSDFNFTEIPTKTVYIFKNPSDNFFTFYEETERKTRSPWKGMQAYFAGRVLHQTEPDSTHSLVWILERISKEPKNLSSAGVSIRYRMEEDKTITLMFCLEINKIFLNPVSTAHAWRSHFHGKGQIVLRNIILGPVDVVEPSEDVSSVDRQNELDFDKFFAYIKAYKEQNKEKVANFKLNSKSMKSKLMDYQVDTVRWMLHREIKKTFDYSEKVLEYRKIADSDLLFYPYIGVVCWQEATETDHEITFFDTMCTVKGGILADEMGLGKTVQVLSLIATHQRDTKLVVLSDEEAARAEHNVHVVEEEEEEDQRADMERIASMSFAELSTARASQSTLTYNIPPIGTQEDIIQCRKCKQFCIAEVCGVRDISQMEHAFICPECIDKRKKLTIKTTLIIVPEPLVFQWSTEVQKHCSSHLRVMFYFGVRKHGYIQPTELDQYDVILTTYDTMRNESAFMDRKDVGARNLRGASPLYVISPLMHVKFWRVIVDESQTMPQGVNTQITKMLMKIKADNWWCVTGTPLVRSVSDMLPLFTFLDILPFAIPEYFNDTALPEYFHLLRTHPLTSEDPLPFNILLDILSKCLSRKTKPEVEQQLALPALEEIEQVIAFTAIEERQYKEERERLKTSVEWALRNARDAELLGSLKVREKVLQELRSLKETILTGQNHRADLSTSGCIYAPETVIFRLVVTKKKKLLEKFRLFMMAANGLAGAYLLAEKKPEAEAAYQYGLDTYQEITDVEEFITNTIGVEKIRALCGPDEESIDEPLRIEGDDVDEEADPRRKERELTNIWKEVATMKRVLRVNEEPSVGGPAPKKPKVEEEPDELDRETAIRQKIGKKLARMALKPMKMDVTQEVHLVLNLHTVQMERALEPIDPARVEPLLERAYGADALVIGKLRAELASIGEAFDRLDMITPTVAYIKKHSMDNPEVFHAKYDLLPQVEHIFTMLPVNLLFEEKNAKFKNPPKHTPGVCMGGCTQTETSQFVGMKNRFLKVETVVEKLCGWMEGVDRQRVHVAAEMDQLMKLVEEMSQPKNLIKLLLTAEHDDADEPTKRMMSMFNCEHTMLKGTTAEKGAIFLSKKVHCYLCDVYLKLSRIQYDAGYRSFHGSRKSRSSVFEFANYLVTHLIHRSDKAVFLKDNLMALFTRTRDLVSTYKMCIVSVVLELVNTLHEFYQAKSTISAETVNAELGIYDRVDMPGKFDAYAAHMVAARNDHEKKFKSELGELRYLVNLMKEQLVGEQNPEECPVCQNAIDAFMVYTCGHRICTECFDYLRHRARRAMNYDTVSCPTCRTTINVHQVMLARSGFAEQNAVIPGMLISAKLTTAILLMREIIEKSDKNKTILFTQVDPSCTRVWSYLQKVLRLAKLPFMAMNRNQFGKKIADFDLGGQNKILLCSLSLCANGLNITGANHIIFLDPPHQKSVLQQAMGRINRFGQKNAMKVYHIVVEGSLDAELRHCAKTKGLEEEKKGWTVGDVRRMFGIEPPNDELVPRVHNERNRAIVELFAADRWDLLNDDDEDEEEDGALEVLIRDPMAEIERENHMWEEILRRREQMAGEPELPVIRHPWDFGALDQIDMGVEVIEHPFGVEEIQRLAPQLHQQQPADPINLDDLDEVLEQFVPGNGVHRD